MFHIMRQNIIATLRDVGNDHCFLMYLYDTVDHRKYALYLIFFDTSQAI